MSIFGVKWGKLRGVLRLSAKTLSNMNVEHNRLSIFGASEDCRGF